MTNNSQANKELKRTKLQGKILKFIFWAYVIVIIVWLVLENFAEEPRTIQEKIGSNEPYSISIKDALYTKAYSITPYAELIKGGKLEEAYKMLSKEYQEYVPYEEWKKTLEGIDFNTFDMKEIKMKAANTYVATIVYERDNEIVETQYMLYANPHNTDSITISPNKFLYGYKDLSFSKDGIKLQLEECVILNDKISMRATIENNSIFSDMTFTSIGVGYDSGINREEEVELSLAPGEKKVIEIEYDVNYYIPNNIKIKRILDEDTLRTYTFYFEQGK